MICYDDQISTKSDGKDEVLFSRVNCMICWQLLENHLHVVVISLRAEYTSSRCMKYFLVTSIFVPKYSSF